VKDREKVDEKGKANSLPVVLVKCVLTDGAKSLERICDTEILGFYGAIDFNLAVFRQINLTFRKRSCACGTGEMQLQFV